MSTDHNCKSCERDNSIIPASKWCSECEEGLCDECNSFHRKGKNSHHHHVVDISEVENVPKIKIPTCVNHKDMKQDFFCVDHDTMCCRQCMAEEHRSCDKVMTVESASQGVISSSVVLNTLKDLERLVDAFNSLSTKANEEVVSLEEKRSSILDIIENKRTNLHKVVDEQAADAKRQLEQQCTKVHQSLKKQGNTFNDLVEKFDNNKKSLQEAVEHGSAHQVFILTQNLKAPVMEGNRLVGNAFLNTEEISFNEVRTTTISYGEICHSAVKIFDLQNRKLLLKKENMRTEIYTLNAT